MISKRLILLVGILYCFCKNNNSYLVGTYKSISESEWNVIVELKTGNRCVLINENWEPGRYEERSSRSTDGIWSTTKDGVVLCFGVCDTMVYSDSLSLEDIGRNGYARGLAPMRISNSKSLISTVTLWRLPHKFINE